MNEWNDVVEDGVLLQRRLYCKMYDTDEIIYQYRYPKTKERWKRTIKQNEHGINEGLDASLYLKPIKGKNNPLKDLLHFLEVKPQQFNKYYNCIQCLISNCIIAKIGNHAIFYSRGKMNYPYQEGRFIGPQITYTVTTKLIDLLEKHGYITNQIAKNNPSNRISSSFAITAKMAEFIDDNNFIVNIRTSLVQLRKSKKTKQGQKIKVNLKVQKKQMTKFGKPIEAINKMLDVYNIGMDFTYKGDKSALLLSPTVRRSVYVYDQYSRIFSCGDFESTGRLYDHWFQQIPSLIRKYTLIDGNYCTMYDFSAMGLNILYSVMGIKPESKDFYNLGGQFLKKDIKLATNIMLNTCSYRQAICTIEYEGIKDARGLVMAIQVKHSKVKKGFFKEMGLKGQITESDMAIEIMTIMLESGMPCLSVHDGFATTTKYKNELLKIINSVAKKYISHEVAVKEEFSLT